MIIDELGPNQISACNMKKWADRYPVKVEAKGIQMDIRPKRIIVTSNYAIDECWENQRDIDAIKARFKIHHFDKLKVKEPEPETIQIVT